MTKHLYEKRVCLKNNLSQIICKTYVVFAIFEFGIFEFEIFEFGIFEFGIFEFGIFVEIILVT